MNDDAASELERELAVPPEEIPVPAETEQAETSGDGSGGSMHRAQGGVERQLTRGLAASRQPQGIAAVMESQARLQKIMAAPLVTANIVDRIAGANSILERFAKMSRPWPDQTLVTKVAALQNARALGMSSQLSSVIRAHELVVGASLAKPFANFEQQALVTERLLASFRIEPHLAARLISPKPVIRYDAWLNDSTASPWASAATHGFAINGLVARDSLLLEEDEDEFEVVVETIETEILEPWRQAREATGESLYRLVSKYDPGAAALLQEGWHIVALPGPASLSSASNASLEALTRTLRVAAPDDAVRLWAEEGGMDRDQVEHEGRVTRSARVRYLMRGRKKERKLVMAQIQALVISTDELTGRLNAGKHASVGDMRTAQTNLMVTEALLSALLTDAIDRVD